MDAGLTWRAAMTRTHQVDFSPHQAAEQHFTTSIDIGDHIAREILRRCAAVSARHRIDRPWIVDVGAGSGRLLAQLLHLGFPADRLLGVDVRPAPDLPVQWIQGWAPDCLPRVEGVVVAHEFLDDVPADVLREGRTIAVDGSLGPPADPADLAWAHAWGEGVCGRSRDEAWQHIVDAVVAGEAIAVDFPRSAPVGHRRGRRMSAVPDGTRDISAGVEFRSLRARTGGRLLPQHRVLPRAGATLQESAELAVLRDPAGLGAFLWLRVEVAPSRPAAPPGG